MGELIFSKIPTEAIDQLQILQPAIGCLNRCDFCSQQAGVTTREMSSETLRSVLGGIKDALHRFNKDGIGNDRNHKPGVIFPYLDNDIGSYPHLIDFIEGVASWNSKVRLSTVGWSRHNTKLQKMHEIIANNYSKEVDGIRFSLTPYAFGWRINHDEYIKDFANAVKTYIPFVNQKGVSRRTACIEMRFRPDIDNCEVVERRFGDYTVIQAGDYALITERNFEKRLKLKAWRQVSQN